MDPNAKPSDWDRLSTEEKVRRLQELWDDLLTSSGGVGLTEAQKQEIERRLREYDENPELVVGWDEVRRRLRRPA